MGRFLKGGAGALLCLLAAVPAPATARGQERIATAPQSQADEKSPSFNGTLVREKSASAPKTQTDEKSPSFNGALTWEKGVSVPRAQADEKTLPFDGTIVRKMGAIVTGAVGRPGTYPVLAGDRLSSLLDRAGGLTDGSFPRGAVFSRISAGGRNRKELETSISRLEKEAFSVPGDEGPKRGFLEKLKKLAPGTRVPVRISHPRLMKGTGDDLLLEDGDTLDVPVKPGVVTVAGAVRTPGPVPLDGPGADPGGLVGKAGGFADDADRRHPYLLKADGTAVPLWRERIRWNPRESRWEIPWLVEPFPAAEPGDTIVVPRAPASSWARGIRDLGRLLMEIHVLTGERVDPP